MDEILSPYDNYNVFLGTIREKMSEIERLGVEASTLDQEDAEKIYEKIQGLLIEIEDLTDDAKKIALHAPGMSLLERIKAHFL